MSVGTVCTFHLHTNLNALVPKLTRTRLTVVFGTRCRISIETFFATCAVLSSGVVFTNTMPSVRITFLRMVVTLTTHTPGKKEFGNELKSVGSFIWPSALLFWLTLLPSQHNISKNINWLKGKLFAILKLKLRKMSARREWNNFLISGEALSNHWATRTQMAETRLQCVLLRTCLVWGSE